MKKRPCYECMYDDAPVARFFDSCSACVTTGGDKLNFKEKEDNSEAYKRYKKLKGLYE